MAKYLELAPPDAREKVKQLPPWAKGIFSEFLEELYTRETNKVIGFLRDSRSELRSELRNFRHEQEELRGESLPPLNDTDSPYVDPREASLARHGISHEKLQRYLQRKLAERAPKTPSGDRTSSSLSFASTSTTIDIDDCFESRPPTRDSRTSSGEPDSPHGSSSRTSKAVSDGGKSGRSTSNSEGEPARSRSQPESRNVMTSRRMSREVTLPGTPEPLDAREKTMKESEALIAAAEEVEAKNENERERQWEKVKKAKEKKKKKRLQQADLAAQMVELATVVAAAQSKDKERQEQKIKERLEEIKRKKEVSNLSAQE